MSDLKEQLEESGCSTEFIADALRYAKFYKGDIDDFIDKVEDILMGDTEDEYDDEEFDEKDDPIYTSDYNYDGNEDDIYFDDEEEDEYEDDEEDEY